MATFDVVTIGGAVRDITFYTSQGKVFATPDDLTAQKLLAFEYGAKIYAQRAHYELGGGALNAAVSLSRLRLKTAALVRLGNDQDAADVRLRFKREQVCPDFIQVDPKAHTGFSLIVALDKREHEHVAFLYRGANENLTAPLGSLKQSTIGWLYLTALSGPRWPGALKQFFQIAKSKQRNTKIVWNPGSSQLQAGRRNLDFCLRHTDVLILNKDEAIELVLSGITVGRRNPSYLNRPLYLLNILKEWGPKVVIITDGTKGAWAYDGARIHHQHAVPVKRIADTTGVGDAFGSGFLAGFVNTKGDSKQALRWGVQNAGSVCTQVGAQNGLLTLRELKGKIKL
ncbi:MAG: hypothetical protein A2951_02815 [Candidatus Buchananbacteria bacterium RIFCSPLOWO2_01_FULL_56_15]|uniref:Carbohydrate kinase PfkB domain-containing protein n=2 Tax=Candidatus Buchananiibacteriota TaxID=1817903 RepID=A0A1G1YDE4_9BACT|nr:MAG: hypothetical protein A3J59_01755 [Candidatus Buchananbacteria bacterium RIFCSPHIGHO2_02_FULL_56_16]OGY54744.1 MAG: hypothetical protein A2951_02815 [Candidatus Buchananbacteria bacterium RIFCSPLOWO2_01_FULL_56_15]